MARISTKNQITIPVAALDEAGLHAGEQSHGRAGRRRRVADPPHDHDLRGCVRDADGHLPAGYLGQLDAEDEER